jgi:peptidoglycan/xylan/chitin deacetylase (PgdA/CDA1 family)
LTFDDGPGEDTPQVLEILKLAGVRSTFFLCGSNVARYPDLARRIAEEGHEIGNHTYSHPRLLGRSPGKMLWEIDRAQRVIEHYTGCKPQWFRPPYGLRWFGLSQVLRQQNLRTVMWSVNGRDWKVPPERIRERILKEARRGSIILLHDAPPPGEKGDRKATVEALPDVLAALSCSYKFVTVSEMQSLS